MQSIIDFLKKSFNLNNLIDWSDQILSTFDTDTIINYGGLLLIIWGLLSIILMYSGSYAIDRLQLRGRYRILDRFIDYRLKIRKIRKKNNKKRIKTNHSLCFLRLFFSYKKKRSDKKSDSCLSSLLHPVQLIFYRY